MPAIFSTKVGIEMLLLKSFTKPAFTVLIVVKGLKNTLVDSQISLILSSLL